MNSLRAAHLIHDEPEIHACRIHDMPHGERPREKLAHLGPSALDNAELMAL
ncbi:MAG: UPF0758 domain-containing protein, partial [Luteolibacter sp.]